MTSIIAISVVGFLTFLLLNHIALTVVFKKLYAVSLKGHTIEVDGTIYPYVPAVLLLITVSVLGVWMFVLGRVSSTSESFLQGISLGFVIYGFHSFFNLTLLKEHNWKLALVELFYGTFLIGAVSVAMFMTQNFLR